jgi:predicted CXXCH cytochrome family protein
MRQPLRLACTLRRIVIAAVSLAISAGAIGIWYAWSLRPKGALARAAQAYNNRQWASAADLARQALKMRRDDPAALKLLARSSARLGRADIAIAIYTRSLDPKAIEAEDDLLLGQALERRGQLDRALATWNKLLEPGRAAPHWLDELARLHIQAQRWEQAIAAAEQLGRQPGWEARGLMLLGTIRAALYNPPDAALSFRRAMELDPAEIDNSQEPIQLRKLIARTFLRIGSPDEAERVLQPILERGPDSEASWLLSRSYLQKGDKPQATAALDRAGSYRASIPLEPEPSPYVGEARCEKCHSAIFRDSLASRHTQTYYRGTQLDQIPLPKGPLPDPDDPKVTHTFSRRDGTLREETRVGREVFDAVIDYAFGTIDRYVTTVSRGASGAYHIARMSYYDTPEGKGWDRSSLDAVRPTHGRAAEFQGTRIGVREGLAKCLYCHLTNPRAGLESTGPESADRAIGCERCHGPGGNHIAALQAGFPDLAIVNPARASPAVVTNTQCNDCHILSRHAPEAEPEEPGWIRSQGVGWKLSRCNTGSGGAFGCVTCHDPHKSARATTTAQYEAQCLMCHGRAVQPGGKEKPVSPAKAAPAPASPTCPVDPSKGCIKCHMPRVRIDSLHQDLTDHYIRVRREKR